MFDSHQSKSRFSFDVRHEDFQSKVIDASHEQPILVDFWAEWCAPCHQLTPHLNRVVDELNGRVLLAKVEVDEGDNMKLAGHYRLRGFPTVILFQHGAVQLVGDPVQMRRQVVAGCAPLGPEVDQDRLFMGGIDDLGLKVLMPDIE